MEKHSSGILPSQRYGIEYIEHCAVRAADEQLVFIRRKESVEQHFNIPVANTAVLLLGPGTSLTQQAARICAENSVTVAFCAGGGTPIYLAAINEYRESRYCRSWIKMWDDEAARLAAAKRFQSKRSELIVALWKKFPEIQVDPTSAVSAYLSSMDRCHTTQDLLAAEAHLSKALYALLSRNFGKAFSRKPQSTEFANEFLDAGNYLAYGLAGCCLWVLGIPFSYPLVHGKTRRGALVFDVADIVKDAMIMPNAFIAAAAGEKAPEARKRMLSTLHDASALGSLFETVLAQIPDALAPAGDSAINE